jgi:hypothetical protein
MYTSLMLVALSGLVATEVNDDPPSWPSDYRAARQQATSQQKPLAVFLGSGPQGWDQVAKSGKLSPDTESILNRDYVRVYVDSASEEGRRLARALDVPEGAGLVISNRSGDLMAFHHAGTLSNADLTRYLKRYADPQRDVQSTESTATERVSYYAQPAAPPAAAPAMAPAYYPSFGGGFGGFGGGGGGC